MAVYINADVADDGSDPNAARKAELLEQINYYKGIKEQLEASVIGRSVILWGSTGDSLFLVNGWILLQ